MGSWALREFTSDWRLIRQRHPYRSALKHIVKKNFEKTKADILSLTFQRLGSGN
jgi:hypothetical protein